MILEHFSTSVNIYHMHIMTFPETKAIERTDVAFDEMT